MKDPFLSRRRRPNQPKKLKLVCSFNGTFNARPPSGKLRYTGGETRIVSIDRNIGFSRLKSKISELLGLCPNNGLSFSLKYQLPVEDDDAPLVVITSEDDVRRMIDEYDKLESHGKPTRLWIFVCNDNGYVHRKRTENNISVNFFETENLNDGSGVSCKNSNGFGGDTKGTHNVNRISCPVNINEFESRNSMTHLCGGEFGSGEVQNSAMSANGARFGDDSLRKRVLKQQLLANQQSQIRSFHRVSGLAAEQTEMEFTNENKKFDQPLIDLTSELQGPVSHGTTDLKFGGNPYRANVLDYEYRNTQIQRNDNLGIHSLPVSQFHPLYPRDGNSHVETNSFMQGLINRSGPILSNGAATGPAGSSQFVAAAQFPKQFCDYDMDMMPTGSGAKYELRSDQPAPLSNLDRENVTPWSANCGLIKNGFAPLSCSNQLVGSFYPAKSSYGSDRVWGDLHSGIHNHRFTATGTRNQRTSPYHLRNHRNSFTEIGSHRNARLERRPWVGKFYPGLRSSLNISKQGQAMRSYYPSLWKPWSGYHGHTPEGIGRMMGSGLNYQAYLCDQVYGSKENFTNKRGHELPQPQAPHFAYNGANTSMYDQSLLPTNVTKNALKISRAMDAHEDLLTCSNGEKHEDPRQAPCKTLHRAPTSSQTSCDFKKESQLMEPMEATIDIPGSPRNLCLRKGTELGCNGKLSTIESCVKSFSNHHGSAHAIQGGLASSVDLSLCNLSLSSSKEFEPPAHPAPTGNDISEDLLKPQSKPLELMDEEQLSSGPQVETSNGIASDSSLQNAAKLDKVDERKEEMQQDHPSSLSIEKKADVKESHKCSNANGSIPNNLAAFYSHLASRELQAIKNSDLEYIKELGSGTYGTVFYGKWKGCDVAIKKLKPSCFTEGALEQDRLVADFWKEARILGQLHHPHIVAFYGVVTDGPVTNLATVTEYMVNGSLKQVLQRKDRTIDRRKRLIIAMDAAFGMEYLHEKNIVHFDLKSHNFLVNMKDPQRPVCKIGDLGLSKIKQKTLVSGGVRGTIPWMAPELLNCKKNMVTEKVDVYSFGIVMWELLTGEEPYGNMRSEEIIAGIIEGNLRPEIPSWCDPAWRSLMERCWSSDPNSRPGFSEIAKELRAMSAAMNIK